MSGNRFRVAALGAGTVCLSAAAAPQQLDVPGSADTVDGEAGDDYPDGGSGVDRVHGGFGDDEWVWDLNEPYLDPDQAGSGPQPPAS